MLGIFNSVIRNATRRDVWDVPSTWHLDHEDRKGDRRRAEEDLRREMLIRSGRS